MGHFVMEEWREINIDFESKLTYAVSNLGRIKSYENNNKKHKILKGSVTEGFLFLRFKRQINNEKKYFHYSIHKIIAQMFIPKDDENQIYVLHLDYDKLNNNTSNLKWATIEEMKIHGQKSPAVIKAFQKLQEHNIKNDGAKLRVIDVMRLKKILLNPNRKTRYQILTKQFGVSQMQLHRIKSGENWGYIKV